MGDLMELKAGRPQRWCAVTAPATEPAAATAASWKSGSTAVAPTGNPRTKRHYPVHCVTGAIIAVLAPIGICPGQVASSYKNCFRSHRDTPSEKRKVGGSTPPLTTLSTPARKRLYAAATHLVIALVVVAVRNFSNRLVTAVARSLVHVGCTPARPRRTGSGRHPSFPAVVRGTLFSPDHAGAKVRDPSATGGLLGLVALVLVTGGEAESARMTLRLTVP
jgi:hypothetical protein